MEQLKQQPQIIVDVSSEKIPNHGGTMSPEQKDSVEKPATPGPLI